MVKSRLGKNAIDVSASLAEKATSVTKYGVKQDGSDESSKIQNCLDNENLIYFPAGTYFAQGLNITKSNTTILFHPKAVFKFPSNPIKASMFNLGDANASTYIQNIKLEGFFTIDATGQAVGKLLRGVYVLGVRHFEINGVLGIGFPDGYAVHVAKSFGTPAVIPERGEIRHIRCENGSWGTVAITSGKHIKVENISANVASEAIVDIELDGTGGNDFTENIVVNLVEAENMRAVKITAHNGDVNQIKMTNIRGVHTDGNTPATIQFSHETGSLSNIFIENLYVNGGQYGIYEPNNTIVQNSFELKNVVIENCTQSGTRVHGGTWDNCIIKSCYMAGFGSPTFTVNDVVTGSKAIYTNCKAIDNNNNAEGAAQKNAGFSLRHIEKVVMKDCDAYDTKTTKRQRFGVQLFHGNLITERCNLTPNDPSGGGDYYLDAHASVSGYLASKTLPTGYFKVGDFVKNEDITQLGTAGSKYVILGWERLTTGNAAVMGTDWQQVKFNSGN